MIPVLWDDRAKSDGQIYRARLLDNECQVTAGVGLGDRPLAGGTMHLDAQIRTRITVRRRGRRPIVNLCS